VQRLERVDDPHETLPTGVGVHQPDAQRPLEVSGSDLRPFEHSRQSRDRRRHLRPEACAGCRQRDVPTRAVDELVAELAFESAKALTDPGLGDAEPLGRATEVQLLGEHEEHPKFAELDHLQHR
jgi:hypothetical protein